MKTADIQKTAPCAEKRGFTLIEILAAAVLFGMLVLALTSVFTASAVAWRNGHAGAWGLREARRNMAAYQRSAADYLPRIDGGGDGAYVNHVWVSGTSFITSTGKSAARGFSSTPSVKGGESGVSSKAPAVPGISEALDTTANAKAYVVGVESAGPDGEWDTEDDITSWPKDKGGNL